VCVTVSVSLSICLSSTPEETKVRIGSTSSTAFGTLWPSRELNQSVMKRKYGLKMIILDVASVNFHRPDFGDSKHLWNFGKLLPDYTAQHPRRQSSSYSPPWEPEISPEIRSVSGYSISKQKTECSQRQDFILVLIQGFALKLNERKLVCLSSTLSPPYKS
jgi:hypothetical protein